MDKSLRYELASKFSKPTANINLNRYPRNTYDAGIKWIGINKGDKILKIGCGFGNYFEYYLKKTDKIVGIDISKNNIDYCKKRYKNKMTFLVKDADKKFDFQDNSFDIVVTADTIEHLYNRYNFIKEVYRVLKTGGKLIVITPNLVKLRNRIKVLLGEYPGTAGTRPDLEMYDGGHVNNFTFKTLRELGEQNGFKVIKEYGFGRFGRFHNVFRSLLSGSICMIFEKKGRKKGVLTSK